MGEANKSNEVRLNLPGYRMNFNTIFTIIWVLFQGRIVFIIHTSLLTPLFQIGNTDETLVDILERCTMEL